MECLACGSNNQEDAHICIQCGTTIGGTQLTSSTPQKLDANGQGATSLVAIPEDAVVVRQSKWAYMLSAMPLLVLFGVSLFFDFFTFGTLPIVITIYIIGSRYLSFHKTAYILTEKHLVIFQGSLFGKKRIDLLFADLNKVIAQPGLFGNSLGYTNVRLQLVDQRVVLLQYVPLASPLLEHLRGRI